MKFEIKHRYTHDVLFSIETETLRLAVEAAIKSSADLSYANLSFADNLRLPTGETWQEYLTETVPALLTAGGKSLGDFAEAFQCHEWTNCPMAFAFGVHNLKNIPILYRPRAEQFIMFFDGKQIPWPLPTK